MATIYLGLGSNLGDRQENIALAIEKLRLAGVSILKISKLIETDPVGGPPQEKFLNGALKAQTTLSATQLLAVIHTIEKELGRVRNVKNGPRPIDIDILLYDNLKINTPGLILPHPRMPKREFVMRPLKEIEPDIEKILKP